MPHQQCEMKSDAESRILFRQFDGLGAGGFVYHQACRGENSFAMSADDRLVDGARASEVIRVDDEPAFSSPGFRPPRTLSVFHPAGFQTWRFRQCHSWVMRRRKRNGTMIGKSGEVSALY